jgi:hypothetical protein
MENQIWFQSLAYSTTFLRQITYINFSLIGITVTISSAEDQAESMIKLQFGKDILKIVNLNVSNFVQISGRK